jgi:hypothetical protein
MTPRQQAKSWELRAVTSLSRLWQQLGKKAEAQQMLRRSTAGSPKGVIRKIGKRPRRCSRSWIIEPLAQWITGALTQVAWLPTPDYLGNRGWLPVYPFNNVPWTSASTPTMPLSCGGRAFEHFLIEEVRAYLSYTERYLPLSFWRTSTGLEVDLIIGGLDLAIELKATAAADERHTKGLRALLADQRVKNAIVMSLDPAPRQLPDGIIVYPWQMFCQKLWAGDFAL